MSFSSMRRNCQGFAVVWHLLQERRGQFLRSGGNGDPLHPPDPPACPGRAAPFALPEAIGTVSAPACESFFDHWRRLAKYGSDLRQIAEVYDTAVGESSAFSSSYRRQERVRRRVPAEPVRA